MPLPFYFGSVVRSYQPFEPMFGDDADDDDDFFPCPNNSFFHPRTLCVDTSQRPVWQEYIILHLLSNVVYFIQRKGE